MNDSAIPVTPPSLGSEPWLTTPETQAVFNAITAAGYSIRIVGGAVRNALFGRAVKDVDFATTATPEEVMSIADAAGLTAVPTGIAHGTVTLIVGRMPFEVTTLREDVETFGRHARVAFTEDWAADARRRDFTINALYCDAAGEVSDPLGGYPDLKDRRIRFIGNPVDRIREDYLRILRFFRFHAEYAEGAPDQPGLTACALEKNGLNQLSGERIRAELMRLLAAPGADSSIRSMSANGILPIVLGAAVPIRDFLALTRLEENLHRVPDPNLRLAALALPQIAPGALKSKLKLSTIETDALQAISRNFGRVQANTSDLDLKVLLYRLGQHSFEALVLFEWARSGAPAGTPEWLRILDLASSWPVPLLPVRGADLLARGIPPGPRIGKIITAFERWWMAENFPSDPARIEGELQRLIANDIS